MNGERILDAAVELFWERPSDQISLDEIARRAGVTVQTVIRRFGGRDGVFAAAGARESERVRAQRETAPVGDVAAAVHVLVDHYEELGDRVLKLLAAEQHMPGLAELAESGRRLHLKWCERTFAPYLEPLHGPGRRRRLAQLIAVCDVYMWKLLRRQAGLSRAQTEIAVAEMITGLTKGVE